LNSVPSGLDRRDSYCTDNNNSFTDKNDSFTNNNDGLADNTGAYTDNNEGQLSCGPERAR
jgi:hypothetical protein